MNDSYSITIAGVKKEQKKYPVSDSLDIAAFILFGDVEITVAAAADEMLEITDVKAAFVVARSEKNDIIISGRSMGEINVQVIMEKLGGGGHMMVAGAQLQGISVVDAGDRLKAAIDEYSDNNK